MTLIRAPGVNWIPNSNQKQIPTRPIGTNKAARRRRQQVATTMPTAHLNLASFKAIDPFPPQIRRRLKYADLFQLATAASTGNFGAEQRFRVNSLYDPDYSGTGHQPYGYDQISNLYNKYRVDRVWFKIIFTTPGSAADVLCAASISPGTSAALATFAPAVPLEWPNTMVGHLSSSGERKVVLTGTIDLAVLCGVPRHKYESEDSYSAAVGANPSQVALLSFAVASFSGSASQATSVLCELEYDAVLYERVILGQS